MPKNNYKIFVINLDRSKFRWESMQAQLEKLGLKYERFSAEDGRKISDKVIKKYYSANLNKSKYYVDLSKSEIACYISHLKVCERIVSEGVDYGIVLEDDIAFNGLFKYVPDILNSLPCDWKYIKLISPFKPKEILEETLVQYDAPLRFYSEKGKLNSIDGKAFEAKACDIIELPLVFKLVKWRKPPTGTQAYAITKEGAAEFLSKRSVFFRPIDVDLQFTWESNLNVMGMLPSLCYLRNVKSDISRGNIRYHYPFARLVYKLKYLACYFRERRHYAFIDRLRRIFRYYAH